MVFRTENYKRDLSLKELSIPNSWDEMLVYNFDTIIIIFFIITIIINLEIDT